MVVIGFHYRGARVLSGGSLFRYYEEKESAFLDAKNLAFMVGCLRIFLYSDEEWYLKDIPEAVSLEETREAVLSEFPESLYRFLEQFDSLSTIRLSILRLFEQFQDESVCKNICLHCMDVILASLFPTIEVWSQLVEKEEKEECAVCLVTRGWSSSLVHWCLQA